MEPQEVFLTTDGLQRAMSLLEFLSTTKRAKLHSICMKPKNRAM